MIQSLPAPARERAGQPGGTGADAQAFTSELFRAVLGQLPTGVAVLTALTADGPAGMTANSVTSVSLDPPLILVPPSRTDADGMPPENHPLLPRGFQAADSRMPP